METNEIPNAPQGSGAPTPTSVPPTSQGTGKNIGMAVLAYLGILVIIPLLVSKDDQFVKFHAKQGIVLLIIWIVSRFILVVPFFGVMLMPLISLGCFILVIIGIINAVGGQTKELPVVGQFAKYLTF